MPASDEAASLVDAARLLWPAPGEARIVGRRGRRRTPLTREFLLLPSAERPRVVLPAGHPRAAAAVASRVSTLTSRRQRAIRLAVAAAARTGLADRFVPARLQVPVDPTTESVEDHLTALLGEPVVVSLGVGTARANRKPVLQVLTPGGRTVAFVKVGDTEAARALVDREAAALAAVGAAGFQRIVAPAVLHHGTWRDLRLLVLSPLATRSGPDDTVPLAAMAELAAAGGDGDAAAFWARLRDGAGGRLADAVAAAEARWGEPGAVTVGWSHGDWTPWNMARGADGVVHLWDWERFETATPVGADALHYRVQAHAQRTGDWDGALALAEAEAATLVRASGAAGDPAAVVDLYLLDLARRYAGAVAAAGPLGRHLADRAEWVLAVVERRVAR